MIALRFERSEDIWELLFHKDTFDSFLLQEASLEHDYAMTLEHSAAGGQDVPYSRVRPLLNAFIRQTEDPAENIPSPKGHIVLKASDGYQKSLVSKPSFTSDPDIIKGLILTFRLENETFTVLTGISYQSFTLDKSIDTLWDQAILRSFDHMNIAFTQL